MSTNAEKQAAAKLASRRGVALRSAQARQTTSSTRISGSVRESAKTSYRRATRRR